MAANVESAPEPVVLIIADISGYTSYMTANAKALSHGQALITELVTTIINEVELPLKVAKLEGDAVFLFARKEDSAQWAESKKLIGRKLFKLFERFAGKVNELSSATTCTCNACAHVQKLRLKVVVHSGEALFHQVLQFQELAGVDVIIVHRLLKNTLKADQYLLVTAKAQQDIELPPNISLAAGRETYEGIGAVEVGVYYPNGVGPSVDQLTQGSFSQRFRASWRLFLTLWFKALAPVPDGSAGRFNHLRAKAGPGRIAFAVLTLILTPIYLPVGAVFVATHALRGGRSTQAGAREDHVHTADGSCCGLKIEED
ncbi:MAG TPA: DUF2652 domain-containing protein [Candidatus Dormibacteraeota bacterium]|nr:DUF2652 domain-containing protein [Candidatus Dormibacteraeota bacterium]